MLQSTKLPLLALMLLVFLAVLSGKLPERYLLLVLERAEQLIDGLEQDN